MRLKHESPGSSNNKTDQSVFAWYFRFESKRLGGLVEGLAPEYIQKRSGKVNVLLNNTSLEIVCPIPDYFPTSGIGRTSMMFSGRLVHYPYIIAGAIFVCHHIQSISVLYSCILFARLTRERNSYHWMLSGVSEL